MPTSRFRRRLASPLLLAAALTALPTLAADRPATPEGAQTLQGFFARYLPAAAAGAHSPAAVTLEGDHYLISIDLGALSDMSKAAGAAVVYDPAVIVTKAFEQDDRKWRLVADTFPKIVSRSDDATTSVEITNYQATAVVDPAIAWMSSASASAEKGVIATQAAKLAQTIDFGPAHDDVQANLSADGSVSTTAKADIADIGLKVTGFGRDNAPVNISGRLDKARINVGVNGLETHAIFDLWRLLNARADLAAHETELKGLLRELAAPGLKIVESIEAQKTVVTSAVGAISLANLNCQLGAANAGPQSSISLSVTADGLSLPVALAPPGAADLTPSKIEIGAKFSGVDFAAAANEAIAGMHLQGDGQPTISESDSAKVTAALLSTGPVKLEFTRSRIVAPAIDADFEGAIRYALGKPSGALTIHMRDFDKTMAAIRALGPDVEGKATPALAMAKGLAKAETDGSLTWLIELGEDRSMKVNGIPLGKAPD